MTFPVSSFEMSPGLTSIFIPTLSTPLKMDPPATPPLMSSTSQPGLFTSKDRITISLGGETKSLWGMGILLQIYSQMTSMLYLSWAEIGITGDPSATVPWTNFKMFWYWSFAWVSFTRSILFCNIIICFNFMISMAARCSEVCGWGQVSLAAIKRRAASMTAAPFNMVAIRISCPGQSTKETCLWTRYLPVHPGRSQGKSSSLPLPADLNFLGLGHPSASHM